jgi:hypothetical protein
MANLRWQKTLVWVFLTETPESQVSDTSESHRSVCRVGSLDATSRIQLIDNLLDVDICVNVSKRVLTVEIHVLPTHRTDAFDLVSLLEVVPALLAFQKLRQDARIGVDDAVGKEPRALAPVGRTKPYRTNEFVR